MLVCVCPVRMGCTWSWVVGSSCSHSTVVVVEALPSQGSSKGFAVVVLSLVVRIRIRALRTLVRLRSRNCLRRRSRRVDPVVPDSSHVEVRDCSWARSRCLLV